MPDIRIYIRERAWAKLMVEVRHDRKKAKRIIADMVHEKYA